MIINQPAVKTDAARLNARGIEADASPIGDYTYAFGKVSGEEHAIYREGNVWLVLGSARGYDFPALVEFLRTN